MNANTLHFIGSQHGNFGHLFGVRIFVHVCVGNEQRATGQHQIVHGGKDVDARALADNLVDHLQVVTVLAEDATDHAVGKTQLHEHGAHQCGVATHGGFGYRRSHATTGHQF